MSTPIFVPLAPAMTVERIGAASSEAGLCIGEAVPDDANEGALQIRGSGDPDAATSLDIVATRGGYATGPYLADVGTPGMQVRWGVTGVSPWFGYIDPGYLRDIRTSYAGGTITDTYAVSEPRQLQSGVLAVAAVGTYNSVNTLRWFKRSTRTGMWSTVDIATGVDTDWRPGWVQLPTGRIIVYGVTSGAAAATAWTSTDDGATWAVWSTDTRITTGAGGTLCAEVVRDAVLVAVGPSEGTTAVDVVLCWSADGGQGFSSTVGDDSGDFRAIRLVVTAAGMPILLAIVDDGDPTPWPVRAYGIAYGGGLGTYVTTGLEAKSTAGTLAATVHDDGAIWAWSSSDAPADFLEARVSLDGGLTWHVPGGDVSALDLVFSNAAGTGGFNTIAAGTYKGALVVIGCTDSSSTADNSLMELWFGGYDSITESGSPGTNGSRIFAGYYGYGACLAMTDTPNALGWTKTDAGTGSTITVGTGGLKMVTSAGGNTRYTAPAAFFSGIVDPGDSIRMRWVVTVDSGGATTTDTAYLLVGITDGTNRQWVKLRFGANVLRILDNAGTLASATPALTSETEFLLAFAHDYPSAGGGLVSVWYKAVTADTWTALVTNQAVAEEAGVGTDVLEFGGSSLLNAATWYMQGPWWAPGSAEMDAGFTSPDDLHGRSLSAEVDVYVSSGIRIGGRGDAAVPGDAWTLPTAYALGAVNLLRSLAPSCRAETEPTNAQQTYVFGDGTMPIVLDTVALIGTNYRTAVLELSASNSWGSPADSVTLDATVFQGTVSSSVDGCLTFAAGSFAPHRFRTTEARRWFVTVSSATYEILDNDDRRLFVTGITSGKAGTAYVFADRMCAQLTGGAYSYARLKITAQTTADGAYRTGTVWPGLARPVSVLYDSGFVDRHTPRTTAYETSRGYRRVARAGAEMHELRIAWGIVDRLTFDYLENLVYMLRGLDGEAQPILFWRDPGDSTACALYTVDGPPTVENVTGEGPSALERLSQLRLREFR